MIKLPALVLGLILLLTGINQKVFAQDEDISLQTFYDELSPYGTWIQDPQYGYVWRPDVDQREFRPYYTNGRWVMTEYGNTWVSEYDWGWAPFHYGRWVTDRYNQWLWIPDTTWGPAWVNWRSGAGQYGWAPLGPSISIGFNIPSFWWVFVPQTRIYVDRFPRYRSYRNPRYISNTVIINNVYVHNRNTYYTGPRRDEIRRVINRDVPVYNINRIDRPGRSGISNNTVNVYNPRPVRGVDNRKAAPRTVVQKDALVRNDRGAAASTRNRNDARNERPQQRNENQVRPSARSIENRTDRSNDNRISSERVTLDRATKDRNSSSEQRALATRAQREQRETAQRNQVENVQRDAQQREQRDAQQRDLAQRQQRDQAERQQRDAQQREQRDAQQRQQREAQQNQQREAQQRQQRDQAERQQRESQQRQQRQEMSRPQRSERVQAPQRSAEPRSTGSSNAGAGATRSTRGGRG